MTYLLQQIDHEVAGLKAETQHAAGCSELTLRRLRRLLQAKVEHRKALAELLAPLTGSEAGSLAISQAVQAQLPVAQSLTGYYANLHRDWSWETDENARSLACLEAVLAEDAAPGAPAPDLGQTLVLGAGGCRLAYDLLHRYRPAALVAADLNPLMLLAAQRILSGKSVRLYEFPLAPRDLDSHAVLRKCAAPKPAKELTLVFADAMAPPFASASFDTVVTPWLIDIIPQDLGGFAATVNRLLRPGGRWLNFGSLVFNHGRAAHNYSYEEAMAVVAQTGFELIAVRRDEIPYMRSPLSHHARLETTVTFHARKARDAAPAPRYQYLPAWLTDSREPVPRLPLFAQTALVQSIYLDVLALIDGQRNVGAIAALFGAKHGLGQGEAEASINSFLLRHYESGLRGSQY